MKNFNFVLMAVFVTIGFTFCGEQNKELNKNIKHLKIIGSHLKNQKTN